MSIGILFSWLHDLLLYALCQRHGLGIIFKNEFAVQNKWLELDVFVLDTFWLEPYFSYVTLNLIVWGGL